jgi:hypothetical protein
MSESSESDNSGSTFVQLSVDAGQFLEKLTGGAFEELGGLAADWLRYQRLKFTADRLEGARGMLREVSVESPKEVALSTLAPWLEGASVEEDPSLHEMWESLLANAGDPRDGSKKTHRSFVRILKQIEVPEQKVLEALYHIDEEAGEDESPFPYPVNSRIMGKMGELDQDYQPTERQIDLAKVNLVRLGLCSRSANIKAAPSGLGGGGPAPEPKEAPRGIHISKFGSTFYRACQPPESENESGGNHSRG